MQIDSTSQKSEVEMTTSSTLVLTLSDEWVKIHSYFMEFQMTQDDFTRCEIVERLSRVEHSLKVILNILRQEKEQMSLSRPLSQLRVLDRGSTSSISSKSSFFISSRTTSPQNFSNNNSKINTSIENMDKNMISLPPCYTYLWDDSLFTCSIQSNVETSEEKEKTSPIGHIFLLSLCQFAKHNEPPGTRKIILQFLAQFLSECDLPPSSLIGNPPRSLLQIFPSYTIVPLMDMIKKIGISLHPNYKKQTKYVLNIKSNYFSSSNTDSMNEDFINDEIEAFLIFLCTLTEKIVQVPALATFFLPNIMIDNDDCNNIEKEKQEKDSFNRDKEFIILQEFITYITLQQGSSQSLKYNNINKIALQGLINLAKCPDPIVQDCVKRHTSIISLTLTGACKTILTLCKVPDNDNGVSQIIYLCDLLHFWSQIILLAPSVAEYWELTKIIEHNFIRDTILPLFQSTDEIVYNSIAIIISKTIKVMGRSFPFYISTITYALLATKVDPITGRVKLLTKDNKSLVSFLEYNLLPHLSLEYEKDWKNVEVTLHLLNTLALYEPVLFMKFALSLSISNLNEVYIKALYQKEGSKLKISNCKNASTTDATNNNNNKEIVKTRHVDCFQNNEFFIDLSAAKTSPPLDIAECFSKRIRAPIGCMLSNNVESIAEEVLTRLLLIESHVPVCILEKRQRIINYSCTGNDETLFNSIPVQNNKNNLFNNNNNNDNTNNNIWFHKGIHTSFLIIKLCEITSQMISIPAEVCQLLTNLWITICLLPDLRVLYTLMDTNEGKLYLALIKLREMMDLIFQQDEDVAFAVASAAAAMTAGNICKSKNELNTNNTKTSSTPTTTELNTNNTKTSPTPTTSELNITSIPPASTIISEKATEIMIKSTPSTIYNHKYIGNNKNTPIELLHNTASHLYTRTYLYSQFIQLDPFLQSVGNMLEQKVKNQDLLAAFKTHRIFLEACLCIEVFRMELDAVIGHVVLSHNLMCLQTGKENISKRNIQRLL